MGKTLVEARTSAPSLEGKGMAVGVAQSMRLSGTLSPKALPSLQGACIYVVAVASGACQALCWQTDSTLQGCQKCVLHTGLSG